LSGKLKFNPEITRVKLNPEQAVLSCQCVANSWQVSGSIELSNAGDSPGCYVPERAGYYTGSCSTHGSNTVMDSSQTANDIGS
jgi:hypothetical protein